MRLKSAAKEKPQVIDQGLSDLIQDADTIFSKWLRLSQANEYLMVNCFTCNNFIKYTKAQAGHYVKRNCLYLRWDIRNVKIQCEECNVLKGGNYLVYTKKLEDESPGIVEILTEESRIIFKPGKEEIRAIIKEYTEKLHLLKLF